MIFFHDLLRGIDKKPYITKILLCVLLMAFSVQAGTSMLYKSATWDETHYFGLGKYLLTQFKWDVPGSILHPPLPYYITGIPLFFYESIDQKFWVYDSKIRRDASFLGSVDIARGQALLSSPPNKDDTLLNLSRFMTIITAVLLGYFVFRWGQFLYGTKGAILALFFFAFSPNLLAHARLITTEMATTTFMFAATYFFWKVLRFRSWRDAFIGGFFFGLALLSKFTALLLWPMYVLLYILWKFKEKTCNRKQILVFLSIGVFVLFLGYGFNLQPYIQGIIFQHEHALKGHPSFLWGNYSNSGWWYYVIIAFGLKTPIPLLIFFALCIFFFFKNRQKSGFVDDLFLLIPAAVIFGFFIINHQSIGLRYILPLYPFLFVFTSKVILHQYSFKWLKIILPIGLIWYLGSSLSVYPHYLSYFNGLAGGPNHAYKYLVDSNLDWGQDLKGLKRFMRRNQIDKIHLSYFGSDSPDRYGIKYYWLPSFYLRQPPHDEGENTPPGGFLAISVTNLQGVYFENKRIYEWLKKYKPVAKIGYSIFIYHVSAIPPELSFHKRVRRGP